MLTKAGYTRMCCRALWLGLNFDIYGMTEEPSSIESLGKELMFDCLYTGKKSIENKNDRQRERLRFTVGDYHSIIN